MVKIEDVHHIPHSPRAYETLHLINRFCSWFFFFFFLILFLWVKNANTKWFQFQNEIYMKTEQEAEMEVMKPLENVSNTTKWYN